MRQFLQNISGLSAYPVFSLILFMVFALVITIWIIGLDAKYINEMRNLPLNDALPSQKPSQK